MDSLEELAERAEEAGNLEEALRIWRQLAQRFDDPVFFTRLAILLQKLNRWDDAERAFSQALCIDPNLVHAMTAMGHLWATRTDKPDLESFRIAKAWFLRSLQRERNARTLTFLGSVYNGLSDYSAARDAFAEAVQLDPSYEEALFNLAVAEENSDYLRATELLERAINIDPDYFIAHQKIGTLYQKSGDLLRAEYHFRRSIEIQPMEFWSLLYLANLLAVQGKPAKAEQAYRSAMNLHPEIEAATEFFARFLESLGRNQEAAQIRETRRIESS